MASNHHGLYIQAAARLAERVPGVRLLPVARLLIAADVMLVTKHHLDRLTPEERGSLIRLVTRARGRPRNLTDAEQGELTAIMAKLEPGALLATAADRISPVGLPGPVLDRLAGGRFRRDAPAE